MPDFKKWTVLFFLFMIFITPLVYATDLSGELAALREELEIIDYVLSDSSLILLDSHTQAVLYLGKVINIRALMTAITRHVALKNKNDSRQLRFGLEDILKNSNEIKRQLHNYRIPEIDNRIAEISRENIRQATKAHPENDDCGGILTQDYRNRLYRQFLKPKMENWKNRSWSNSSLAVGHGLRKVPTYEVNVPLWRKRVNCVDNCTARGLYYEAEWVKCKDSCFTRKYKICKEY